jgi:carbonic anhydrase/acetyltransferase-like protein (isoleucine patch superfamily)
MAAFIHPTAIIDPNAKIGEDCYIGAFSIIGEQVVLGDKVHLESHVVIDGKTSVGDETKIFPFVSIGLAPQDLKYGGEATQTEIGKRNQIREFVTVHRGTAGGGGLTRIGDDNLLMAQRSVRNLEQSYNYFANQQDRAGQHHTLEMALTMLDRARWTGKLEEAEVYRRWLVGKLSQPLINNIKSMEARTEKSGIKDEKFEKVELKLAA